MPGASQSMQALHLQTIPFDAGSQVFYAKDMGFFAKQGLDVTIDPVNNGPAIAAAVASGAVDIGFSNAVSIETGVQERAAVRLRRELGDLFECRADLGDHGA